MPTEAEAIMRKGYKQTAEHIAKRKRFGGQHHGWKDDNASARTGRTRAERMYPELRPCEKCGALKGRLDRHHRDENTLNNSPENVAFLCRKCHMEADGRLHALATREHRWVSKRSRFTAEDIQKMRELHNGGATQADIGRQFGIAQTAVSRWLRGIWSR